MMSISSLAVSYRQPGRYVLPAVSYVLIVKTFAAAGKLLPYSSYKSSYKYPPFVSPQEYFGSDPLRVLTIGRLF
jgi:hypothetical protein